MASIEGVRLTSPDRVLYADQGVTKRRLAEFYRDIGEHLLEHAARRPLTLVRCPKGQSEQCFYQKHIGKAIPDAVRAVEIEEAEGSGTYMYVESVAGLVALVQVGTLEIHLWSSRVDRLDRPDRLVFDLDPGPEVEWKAVVKAARELEDRLEEVGLRSFVMVTGGKGIHVVAPLVRRSSWEDVKGFARAVSRRMAEEDPERYVATASKAERVGRIYVDYLRNGRGATAVAPYSTRARAGAPVAVPLRWDELAAAARSNGYGMDRVRRRLASLDRDPWEGYAATRQTLTDAMMQGVGA